jgi:hypothetical protein
MVTELAIGADGGELQGDRADPERRKGSNAVMEGKTGQFLPAARCLGKLSEGDLPTTSSDHGPACSISLMTNTELRVMMV